MSERTYGNQNRAPEDKTRCVERVHGESRWPSFHQCLRKRGFGPDGEWCKQHDPAAVEARKKESDERFRKDQEIRNRPFEALRFLRKAVSAGWLSEGSDEAKKILGE